MRILGIESASMVASVAVLQDDIVMAEYTLDFKKTHSQTLLPMTEEITKMMELDLNTIDAIAVSGGPGSFTGLRIGAAMGKGLGLALEKPLIHVPTLDAMAYQCFGVDRLLCPVMDARRNRVYTGIYRYQNEEFTRVMDGDVLEIPALIEKLNALKKPVMFLGDGVEIYGTVLKNGIHNDVLLANACNNRARAAAVATLGKAMFERGEVVSADAFAPDYLRKSQAEQEREAKGLPLGEM